MEQETGSKNKNMDWFKNYQIPLIIAAVVIVVAIIIIAAVRNNDSEDQNTNEQTNEQGSDQNKSQNGEQDQNTGNILPANPPSQTQPSTDNSVTARGILRVSDNASKGNLVMESDRGKIYIATKRDFTSLLNKQVTLQAEGSINQFAFLGFAESTGVDTTARGGAGSELSQVSFSGVLNKSDNMAKGNYTISSGNTKVYLKTVRDYSAWVGSEVLLIADGTINSFNGAKLVKK